MRLLCPWPTGHPDFMGSLPMLYCYTIGFEHGLQLIIKGL
jgi:hypothetical protein